MNGAQITSVMFDELDKPLLIAAAVWDKKEKRLFIWVTGTFGPRGEFEPQICTIDFLPKRNVVFKQELAGDDERSLDQLINDYPWPLPKSVEVGS